MKAYANSLIRSAILTASILGFGTGALLAKPRPFRGNFHDTGVVVGTTLTQQNGMGLYLVIASAGSVTGMAEPVVCVTGDQLTFLPPPAGTGLGTGTYTLRGRCGDSIVMTFKLVSDPPGIHPIMFHGTFTVTGGTGRFTGAKSAPDAIACTGWAEFDDATMMSFRGGWDFAGAIELPTTIGEDCEHGHEHG